MKTSGLSRGQLKRLKAKEKTKPRASGDADGTLSAAHGGKEGLPEPAQASTQDSRPSTSQERELPAETAGDDADVRSSVYSDTMDIPEEMQAVFDHFRIPEEPKAQVQESVGGKGQVLESDEEEMSESEPQTPEEPVRLSRRQVKKLRLSRLPQVKRLVREPDVVDWTDVTARDPFLLIELKSTPNTVPVPSHWENKKEYLSGKRGIDKPPFRLPAYIADTGIVEQRESVLAKEKEKSLKQKTRERVQPKLGKIDVDYQKLHDAFFKFMTKPPMSGYGDVYYEGRDLELVMRERRVGELSEELKEALSMPIGAPPPWLLAMQRHGPPPSYPSLAIPGLNAPLPPGAAWGFHPGGWGRPPLDEHGRPLYGDVFGTETGNVAPQWGNPGDPIERDLFGEIAPGGDAEEESESESESDESEASDGESTVDEKSEAEAGQSDASQQNAPPGNGRTRVSRFQSPDTVPPVESPDAVPPVESVAANAAPSIGTPSEKSPERAEKPLFEVIPERQATSGSADVLPSERLYDLGKDRGTASSMSAAESEEDAAKKERRERRRQTNFKF